MDSSPYLGHDLLSQYAQPNGLFPNGFNPGAVQPQGPMAGQGQIPPQIQQLLRQLIQQRMAGMGGMGGQVPGMPQPQGAMGGGQLPPQIAQMLVQRLMGGQQAPQGLGMLQALRGGGQPGGMPQPGLPGQAQAPGQGPGINAASLLQLVAQMQQQGGAPGQLGTAPGLVRGPQAQGQPMAPRPMQPRQMPALPAMAQVGAASQPSGISPLTPAPVVGVGEFSSPDLYRRNQ